MELSTTGAEPLTFIVKTISGLEEVLAAEIVEIGGANVQILKRAVSFEGDKRMLYKANYCLRTAQRILVPIYSFQMADEDDLYNQVNSYAWENHLTLDKTLAVDAVVSGSELTHSHYVSLLTKDAIVDRFRTLNNGRRPNVDTENPHVRINMHINGSICNVSIDSSGASLHKRGYRVSNAEAPMSEVLAAGLIRLSGWNRDCHFIDPMCGSGTLVIEAAMYASNFPAGMYRKEFGFMHWPDFDQDLWNEVTKEALELQTEFDYQIIGSDISPKNLASARSNLKSSRLHKDVQLLVSPFAALERPAGEPGLIIINPPYGERIRLNDIIGLYKSIGNKLKQDFSGYQAWVISSDQRALSLIGLRPTAKLPVFNGPLECRFEHFDLYKGSKRGRYMDGERQLDEDGNPVNTDSVPDNRAPWRSKDAPENDMSPREFKPREFNPREFRSREEGPARGITKFGKPSDGDGFRKRDKPEREGNFRKDERPERRKAEKQVIRPATRIEEREEYLRPKVIQSDIDLEYPEIIVPVAPVIIPEPVVEETRVPSKGNKFTEKRDYKLAGTKELRPRLAKPAKVEKATPKPRPRPEEKAPKPPVDFDDLED